MYRWTGIRLTSSNFSDDEVLTGIKRAGADIIITYFAKQASSWMHETN
jgi:delta-aminolevulinic acid dehydratase/porphobilinogen synthase